MLSLTPQLKKEKKGKEHESGRSGISTNQEDTGAKPMSGSS